MGPTTEADQEKVMAQAAGPDAMEGYGRRVRLVLSVVLGLNLLVAAVKTFVALRTGSLSVTADTFHSVLDAANNVLGLVILRAATAPPDEDHPWGHAKFETVAAFFVAGLLFVTAFEILQSAVGRLFSPSAISVDPLSVGLLAGTVAVNVGVTVWEGWQGRVLGSELLRADAAHTRADVLVSAAVLAGLGLSRLGIEAADPAIAAAVAGFIAFTGWRIFQRTLPVLTDRAVFTSAQIRAIVEAVPGVRNVHDIRSRGRPGEAYVQMHLVVEPEDVLRAHAITEEIEQALETKLGVREAVIHVEPDER